MKQHIKQGKACTKSWHICTWISPYHNQNFRLMHKIPETSVQAPIQGGGCPNVIDKPWTDRSPQYAVEFPTWKAFLVDTDTIGSHKVVIIWASFWIHNDPGIICKCNYLQSQKTKHTASTQETGVYLGNKSGPFPWLSMRQRWQKGPRITHQHVLADLLLVVISWSKCRRSTFWLPREWLFTLVSVHVLDTPLAEAKVPRRILKADLRWTASVNVSSSSTPHQLRLRCLTLCTTRTTDAT